MVRGLNRFKSHFRNYGDRYVLIGGTACSLSMEAAGLNFRATKDLDIVLYIEALDSDFVRAFWDFIRAGRYQNQQKSTGKKLFYRFYDPEDESYPVMLELFSRKPEALKLHDDSHLTPILMDEENASLSAILLDGDYYHFIHAGKNEIDQLSVIKPEYLIPLKAKAWMDLTERQKAGEKVSGTDIRKHKNDIFRLYQVIAPDEPIPMQDSIKKDFHQFIEQMKKDVSVDLKSLGLQNTSLEEIIETLRGIYLSYDKTH